MSGGQIPSGGIEELSSGHFISRLLLALEFCGFITVNLAGETIDTKFLNIVVVICHRAPAAMSSSLPSFSDFSSKFSEKSLDAKDAVKRLANLLQGKRCDASVIGKWKQVMNHPRSDSLCPLLSGLGAPTFVCGIVDKLQTTLTISCENDGKNLRVIDKTLITKENVTESSLEGFGKSEKRCKTKGGRKEYMLSGNVKMDGTNQFVCRLITRGDGWWTISERCLVEDGKYLRERNILKAPGKKDVVVDRYFERAPK